MNEHRQFFGDAERSFMLTPTLILELERVTNKGIGSLCRSVFRGEFAYKDVEGVIRLALIGGGETPERAAELVNTYVANQPLTPNYALAVDVLQALWNGPPAAADLSVRQSDQLHRSTMQ